MKWISAAAAVAIHQRLIAEHGGAEGVRDPGLLESALARPQNLVAYGETIDLASLAAAYAFGIARNHPFVDGNKRSALVVMRTFLILNGADLKASQEEKYIVFTDLAAGTIREEWLAEWIRDRLTTTPR